MGKVPSRPSARSGKGGRFLQRPISGRKKKKCSFATKNDKMKKRRCFPCRKKKCRLDELGKKKPTIGGGKQEEESKEGARPTSPGGAKLQKAWETSRIKEEEGANPNLGARGKPFFRALLFERRKRRCKEKRSSFAKKEDDQ